MSYNENATMPSSKGKPTDPKLREEVKEEVKRENKGTHVPTPNQFDILAFAVSVVGETTAANCAVSRWRPRLVVGLEGVRDGETIRGERRRL